MSIGYKLLAKKNSSSERLLRVILILCFHTTNLEISLFVKSQRLIISENAFHLYQRNPSSTRPPRKYQRLEIGKDIIY